MASSEYESALEITDIGELPLLSESTNETKRSAIQKILQNFNNFVEGKKKIGFLNFAPTDSLDKELKEIVDTLLISGRKMFRLKCLSASKTSKDTSPLPTRKDDLLAKELLSIVKVADEGYFTFQNNRCMDDAKMELLKYDTEALIGQYDYILLEANCADDTTLLSSQIAQLTNCDIITGHL